MVTQKILFIKITTNLNSMKIFNVLKWSMKCFLSNGHPKCSKRFGKSMSLECKNRIQVAWLISNLKHLGLFPWAAEPFAKFSSRLSLLLLLTSKFQSVWLRMQANYNYGSNTIMVYHLRRYPSAPSLPLSLSLFFYYCNRMGTPKKYA